MASFVLANAWMEFGESSSVFAQRAGVTRSLVAGDEDGVSLAWSWPAADFTAVTEAIEVRDPELARWFTTAAACDLLLTCVLNGTLDLVTAQTMNLPAALALLRWAVRGEPPTVSLVRLRPAAPLLLRTQRKMLRIRALELAASSSPAAWTGTDLVALFAAKRPTGPPSPRAVSSVPPQLGRPVA